MPVMWTQALWCRALGTGSTRMQNISMRNVHTSHGIGGEGGLNLHKGSIGKLG